MSRFTIDTRGQSSTVGVLLIIAVVMTGLTAIGYFGYSGLQGSADGVAAKAAENELQRMGAAAEKVMRTNSPEALVPLKSEQMKSSGDYVVRGEKGRITVTIIDSGAGQDGDTANQELINEPLGVIEYRADNARIAYQGGGVFANYEDQPATVVNNPSISSVNRSNATVNMPVVLVDGRDHITSAARISKNNTRSDEQAYSELWVEEVEGLQVTIESEYAGAWAAYFNETFNTASGPASVTYTQSTDTVVLEYYTDSSVSGSDSGFYFHLNKFVLDVSER